MVKEEECGTGNVSSDASDWFAIKIVLTQTQCESTPKKNVMFILKCYLSSSHSSNDITYCCLSKSKELVLIHFSSFKRIWGPTYKIIILKMTFRHNGNKIICQYNGVLISLLHNHCHMLSCIYYSNNIKIIRDINGW